MRPDDLRALVDRDWGRLTAAKTSHWRDRKARQRPAEILADGDALRRHARTVRPDWPTAADRQEDVAAHQRVAEALGAAAKSCR